MTAPVDDGRHRADLQAATMAPEPLEVLGERPLVSVNKEGSLRARLNSLFAMLLVVVLGAAVLLFYFRAAYARRSDARSANAAQLQTQASAEMRLSPLGAVEPPNPPKITSPVATTALAAPPDAIALSGAPPLGPQASETRDADEPYDAAWDQPALEESASARAGPTPPSAPSPEALQRQQALASPVLFRANNGAELAVVSATSSAATATGSADSPLGALLRTTDATTVEAHRLSTQRWLLPKGAFLDCTLETALDSQLPGMATCITATDVFGVDGQQVLLERGTKLIGETRGEARPGQSRLFVLWNEARTPRGVIVPLASPGTDALGRSGLPGRIDNHFSARFGAAILISVIDGAIQAAVQSQRQDAGSSVVLNTQNSQDILTEILRSTLNIPPTIQVAQGSRIQVLVARDVDFRSIAALRAGR